MTTVELIFDADCPNVEDARSQLRRAFLAVDQTPEWQEWDRSDPMSPEYARAYGSPTILVEGSDVANAGPADGADCCRLYTDAEGRFQGVPSVDVIAAALTASKPSVATGVNANCSDGLRSWLAVLPAIGIAMLPKLACPACWPAYVGVLSTLGLGFLIHTKYLLPLTALFLIAAVAALGCRARRRRGYGPISLGLVAAIVVILGKFVFSFDPAMYGGIALLVGASLWNSWPRKLAKDAVAAPATALYQIGSIEKEVQS
ncbi:MAG: MerC domain-containing protein [Planctomycetota bacterium]|nr:MAG: MerC domain-containing protein [Planctomycetota bacterium]REJ95032.1 MAG: MerC domain-containing protein [Planctomycetota bacterium]REK24563.1 MAG: MerC domain-containing protein [Planctomycetota bacterium]REK49188.1 MAG: MerC domain-containing protein [Planctomycetota bacterium]